MRASDRAATPTADCPSPIAGAYDPAAYWTARLAASDALETVGWQGLGAAYNRWLYRRRAAVFRQIVRAYGFDQHPPRVLELGPGTGFYVDRWRGLGVRELTGIDIAPPAVARLQARFPGYHFLTGDVGGPLALPAGMADVVTSFDLLFHITEEAAFEHALATVAEALSPGGMALVTDLFPRDREVQRPHHVSRTATRYHEALAAVGLRLERRLPVFVLMHPWSGPRSAAARVFAASWWAGVERIAGHVPGAGGPLGAALFAADTVLSPLVGPGASTQLWVLRRDRR